MKSLKICFVILVGAVIINFIRHGEGFPISRTLPFCGGDPLSIYDFAALILLIMLIWGIASCKHKE